MICPIPKNNSPSDIFDYRPIEITSVVMKCFEKIVLHHLLDLTNGMQDPLQFAYKPNRSIEDAILTLLHNTFRHTNNPKSYVRILFDDFLSAFNSIEPYHLGKKLVRLNISPKLAIQIINFLSHRKQHYVKTHFLQYTWFTFMVMHNFVKVVIFIYTRGLCFRLCPTT